MAVRCLIDANYFLRWLLGDVLPQQRTVQRALEESGADTLVLETVSLAEITYVLRGMAYNHAQIAAALDAFYTYIAVVPPTKSQARALDIFSTTSLDFEDCYIVAKAVESHHEIASFDKQLLKTFNQLQFSQ